MKDRRVVITGMGMVSPLGVDLDTTWDRMVTGQSGIGPITHFDTSEYTAKIAGEVRDFNIDDFMSKKDQRRTDPFCHYAIAAAKLCMQDSGLELEREDLDKIGVVIGSGIGGLEVMERQTRVLIEKGPSRFSPFMIPEMITNMAAGLVAIEFGVRGPNLCVTSACATATHAIGESTYIIQRGDADIILAGGAEAPVTELGVGGFCALRALSTRNDDPQGASRPFDAGRDGFVCAEGAGVLVLEEYEHAKKRNAKIYGEVAGYGRTCDAHHMTAPLSDGSGASRCMSIAMQDAGVNPEDVDYINAHGTSTQLNDKSETKAIKIALGEEHARKVSISSTKSMTGHLLGAAGAIESFACMKSLTTGVIAPTINYETPDPECDLEYTPNTAQERDVKVCLNNSLGFGGHNATLCFRKV